MKSETGYRGLVHLRFALLALCAAALFLAIPSSSAASPQGPEGLICMIPEGCGPEPPCMIEPWECEPGPGEPGSCIPGRYIIVFWDWVEDPGAIARAQVEKYGGTLGFIYQYALKGYSAGYSKEAVEAVRKEPTVNYVEPDRVVGLFGASSTAPDDECEEPVHPPPPEGEPPGTGPICMIPEGCPETAMPPGKLPPPGTGPICMIPEGCGPLPNLARDPGQCRKGKVRRGNRCVRKRHRLAHRLRRQGALH